MLGADYLIYLGEFLDDIQTKTPAEIETFRLVLDEIYSAGDYQTWINTESINPGLRHSSRYKLPFEFGTDLGREEKWLLDHYRLINGRILEVLIDKHYDRIHITDGPWVPPDIRVYPYADESIEICSYARSEGLDNWAEIMIDPAAGCGHHGLGLAAIPHKISLDKNQRALAYCRINAIISNNEKMFCGYNDIRDGFPTPLKLLKCSNALVPVNMPFSIFPKVSGKNRSLAQDGGDRGIELTLSLLRALKNFAGESGGIDKLRAIILFYSLGKETSVGWDWEVVNEARSLFGESRVKETMLFDKRMWRVNGIKTATNPMPLSHMRTKARCTHTFREFQMSAKEREYIGLEKLFKSYGYSHLGYGILDIEAK